MSLTPVPFKNPPAWWDLDYEPDMPNSELACAVTDAVQDIDRRQPWTYEGNRRHARIYAGYLPSGLAMGTSPLSNARAPFAATKALVRSVCDTAHAMIVRSRPKSSFVTDGADWKVAQQAEDMDQFMVGAFTIGGLYQVAPRSFHDTTVFGTGGWKYVPVGSGSKFKVRYDRIIIDDIVVDEDECREHLVPQTLYHRPTVRIDALIRKYAKTDSRRDCEMRANLMKSEAQTWPGGRHVPKGQTILIEAYHIDPEGNDHRRVLVAGGVVLESEKWPFPWHPFTFLWWSMPITGFYGDGIAYRQFGRQERVTYMHKWITKVLDQFGTPTAWIDPAGGPPTMQMSNELGKIIAARRPPVFQAQQMIAPEIYNWLNKLENDGFEDEGISQMTSSGQLPPGIESAPAQRELTYKEGQRFAPVSQRWEHAIAVETAEKTAAFYRRASASSQEPANVKWADRKLVYTIDWPDLEEDAYMIRAEASSLDALSPSARAQSALELAQTGWISMTEGRALVGHPDLKESDKLGNAPETYAKWVLRKLLHGEVVLVDEKSQMEVCKRVVSQGRLWAKTQSAPDNIIDNMTRYLDEIDELEKSAMEAAMAEQAALAPPPGISEQSAEGRPTPFSGGKGYT